MLSSASCDGRTVRLTREPVLRRHHHEELVTEERCCGKAAVADGRQHQGEVELPCEQDRERPAGGVDVDAHIHAGASRRELVQNGRQPVIARVALGRDAQQTLLAAAQVTHCRLGALELSEHRQPGVEQVLPRRRRDHASVPPQEQWGLQPILDVLQLVTEGGLREVQPLRRGGEGAVLGDGNDQAQVTNFQIHKPPVRCDRSRGGARGLG